MTGIHHFLFGSINLKDEPGKIYPDDMELLVALQQLTSGAESAGYSPRLFDRKGAMGSGRDAFEECARWASRDIREEVGWISFPLAPTEAGKGEDFQVLCRMYHSWASGNRPSSTGHAYVLTSEDWQAIDFNPFRIPHLYENAARYQEMGKLADEGLPMSVSATRREPWERIQEIRQLVQKRGQQIPEKQLSRWLLRIFGQEPIRLPKDADEWLFELLVLLLPAAHRRRLAFWSGAFGVTAGYEGYFVLGRGAAEAAQGPQAEDEAGWPDARKLLCDEQAYHDFVRKADNEDVSFRSLELTEKIKSELNAASAHASGFPRDAGRAKDKEPLGASRVTTSGSRSGAVSDSARDVIPDPEEPPRERSRFPWRVIMAVLIVAAFFFFWRDQPVEPGVEEWNQRVEGMSAPGDAFALFAEGLEILQTATASSDNAAAEVSQQLRRLQSRMHAYAADASGEDTTQGEIWDALERVYAVHRSAHTDDLGLRVPTEEWIDRFRTRESWLITQYDASAFDERRRSLTNLEKYYAGGTTVPPPDFLRELQDSTTRIEAQLAFGDLRQKWGTVRTENPAASLPQLVSAIDAYRGRFDQSFHSVELDGFEEDLYRRYEGLLRRRLEENYRNLKRDLTLERYNDLKASVKDYDGALRSLPPRAMISRLKKVDDTFRQLSENPRLSYVRSRGSARIGLRHSHKDDCDTRFQDSLRLDEVLESQNGRVCVDWRLKDAKRSEEHDFSLKDIKSRRRSRQPFEVYWSWPTFG